MPTPARNPAFIQFATSAILHAPQKKKEKHRPMFGAPPKELPQKLAFLLVPNFSMIAFTSAVEPLRLANRASGQELYSWHLFSGDGRPVTASNGIAVTPEGR